MSQPEPVDLSNCEREPIHIPGAIQPHGVLVACAEDGRRVTYASANVDEAFGESAGRVLGAPLSSLLDAESAVRLDVAVRDGLGRDVNPVPLVTRTGRTYEGIVHRSTTDGVLVLELEAPGGSVTGFHPTTRAAVRRLQSATDRQRLCDITAEEVRRLTGFDRVMVYRFDQDWNGEVVAESRRLDLEPFLGLHYPAADIPAQARRLYTLNWLRIIPDIGYRPCPIVAADADGAPLDLSFATLRSVSPIHVEYLQNMGVSASMSVSLVRDDTLIGLVACHHYSGPHHVPFAVRETCEFLGQALSWHLTSIEGREGAELAADLQRAESAIVAAISTARSLPEGICTPPLLQLTGASGAALLYEGRTHTVGTVPNDASVTRIVEALRPPAGQWLSWTDHVSSLVP
ncbi:MAG TPA: GAF domain-containing protein, partial [Luteitalea sp.]|nr:GAF domain-containing protein [Luteitalea sp.]